MKKQLTTIKQQNVVTISNPDLKIVKGYPIDILVAAEILLQLVFQNVIIIY